MHKKIDTPKVKDILTKKVIGLRPEFTSLDAIRIFNKYRISSAPVINERRRVIGYLSESDCMKCISNSLFYDESRGCTIDLIMSREVSVAEIEWNVFELEGFFISKDLRSAPVVDPENHLVGIVTRKDALLALEGLMRGREEYIRGIKTPVELNMQEKIKMIVNRVVW